MTLSRYVDGLEKAGLVVRRFDPKDRRAKCVVPTDAAAPVLGAIRRLSDGLVAKMEIGLEDVEKETLRKALRTMRDNSSRL